MNKNLKAWYERRKQMEADILNATSEEEKKNIAEQVDKEITKITEDERLYVNNYGNTLWLRKPNLLKYSK